MAYNEDLAMRVNTVTNSWDGLVEKKMFAKPFDITGRPMKGWVMIQPMDLDDNQFAEMIHTARKFVQTLPAK
jgi:hypothetical protein